MCTATDATAWPPSMPQIFVVVQHTALGQAHTLPRAAGQDPAMGGAIRGGGGVGKGRGWWWGGGGGNQQWGGLQR